MKKLILFLAAVCMYAVATAQFKVLSTSGFFAEPEVGAAKIIKAQNGHTYFLHFEKNGKISIRSYNTDRKLAYNKTVEYESGGKKVGNVTAVYEINGQILCFIYRLNNKVPTLLRVIINGATGTIASQETIAQFGKLTMGSGYAMVLGGVPEPDFFIRKDDRTNSYAIALFNTFAENRNERIELLHFNERHEVISRSFYDSPNDGYKYMEFLDMYVDGNEAVYVVAKGKNTPSSGGDQNGGLFVGKLNAGANAFDMSKLTYNNAKDIKSVILRYNDVTGRFLLLSNKQTGKNKRARIQEYAVYLATFDKNLGDVTSKQLTFGELDRVAKTQFKKREKVNAIPQSLFVNKDGSYTIVLEEMKVVESINQPVGGYGSTAVGGQNAAYSSVRSSKIYYYLNDIGIVKYDKDGNQVAVNYLPKSHRVYNIPSPLFYSFRNEMAYNLGWGTQYKSFQYLDGPANSYVLFNDVASNQKKMKAGKKVTTIQGLGDCDGYYYKISGKGIPQGKKVVTGEKKDKNLMLFTIGHYDAANNEYIVLNRAIRGKKKKGVAMMWLQPE